MKIYADKIFDRRVTPARPDLAAEFLRGEVEAQRYVPAQPMQAIAPIIPLRPAPDMQSSIDTQILFGQIVDVYDIREDWAYLQLRDDHYVGYAPIQNFTASIQAPDHRVINLFTPVYPRPDIKSPALMSLPLNAQACACAQEGDFARIMWRQAREEKHGYIYARHLAPVEAYADDFVAIAERFIGAPYLWGGKTALGIDCSGLAQTALNACGITAPRDADMQFASLGAPFAPPENIESLRRGDLIHWKGHIGIIRDPKTLLHANGWSMNVLSEPLRETIARIQLSGGGAPTGVQRLS